MNMPNPLAECAHSAALRRLRIDARLQLHEGWAADPVPAQNWAARAQSQVNGLVTQLFLTGPREVFTNAIAIAAHFDQALYHLNRQNVRDLSAGLAYRPALAAQLADVAGDVEANAVVNDQVVANLAFLLPASRQAEFDRRVEALDQALGGELNFKVVGPLPPYSFSTVEVDHLLPDDIEWARGQLGIGCSASGDEIRAAYLQQARLRHPDNNQQDADATTRFKDANSAYRLLRYCHNMQYRTAAPSIAENEFRCDFGQIADAGLLLVNISRSSDVAAHS
jgi:hypothetical protein